MSPTAPVVLVTGGSSGLGRAVVQRLLDRDWVVYVAALEADSMTDLEVRGALPMALDVRDDEAVAAAVTRVVNEQGRIDILLNNAGYGQFGLIECVAIPDIQRQFDVKVFGYARFQAALPHMRRQRSGRIITRRRCVDTSPSLAWAGTPRASTPYGP